MSFRTKTILLLIVLSLAPYVITLVMLGRVYRSDVESRLIADMEYQLGITLDRLNQSVQTLENDMHFIASLDVINDVLTGDLDKRISNILALKKNDLGLVGDFHVIDPAGSVVASTDVKRIGSAYRGERFRRTPLQSTFSDDLIGELVVDYDLGNLSRIFINDEHLNYTLIDSDAGGSASATDSARLRVEAPLAKESGLMVRLEQDRTFAFAALNALTRSFYLALLIGMLVIASIAYLVANYIINPILQLSTTARKITKTQDFSQRVSIVRKDEIGDLSDAFNQLIEGIQLMLVRLKDESENRLKLTHEKNRAEMLQSLSNKLSKYLSPQIYESIFSGEKDVTLSSSRKKLTIFFSDIVGFTSTADQMESEDLTQLLNQYLQEMTDIALRYGATIDKYIGDAIMIFFGDPHSNGVESDAQLCVEMATAMQFRVKELQSEWRAAGYTKPFNIRVGIHTAYCTVGNFGTESRMDYTIIGSAVNLASRIESNTQPGEIYVSEDTYLLVKAKFACAPAASVTPRGLSSPIQLYRVVMDSAGTPLVELNQAGAQLNFDSGKVDDETMSRLNRLVRDLRGSD